MKYVRKISAIMIAAVFLAAFAIGVGVVYTVRNVNVSLVSYYPEGDAEGKKAAESAISAIKSSLYDACGGTVIYFVDEGEVRDCVEKGFTVDGASRAYSLESVKKIYPCTIDVTVKERRATYAIANGAGYDVYDESGAYLRASDENINKTELGGDGAPFVLLEGITTEAERREIASLCSVFGSEENFSAIRASVEKVVLTKAQSTVDTDKLTFTLRCGLTVEMRDYANGAEEKIALAAAEFASLTGEQKLSGTIYFSEKDGVISATYEKK